MGKVRRYKKKLAKAATGTGENDETGEQPGNVDYLELAEELLSIKKDDDKISVCSVMKSLKSNSGESLKLKKDSKRYLKHAILLKRLEKTQKSLKKNKKKKKSSEDNDDNDDEDDNDEQMSHQKVLDWPDKNLNKVDTLSGPPKKYRKGFHKKQNAQLAKDLVLFSKKIKKQSKHPAKNAKKIKNLLTTV